MLGRMDGLSELYLCNTCIGLAEEVALSFHVYFLCLHLLYFNFLWVDESGQDVLAWQTGLFGLFVRRGV
jgi:hypothetical protein